MKSKMLASTVCLLPLLLLISGPIAHTEEHEAFRFSGLINDYTPADPTIKGSPYEMHGQWSMELHPWGAADFQADMTMSDFGSSNGMLDATMGGQNAHTHHIQLTNIKITPDMNGCPAFAPATTIGFQVNGKVHLMTGNGGNAPFETSPPTSTLQVCVTGGKEIPYSNITLVFAGPASTHFGTQAIHGVVRVP